MQPQAWTYTPQEKAGVEGLSWSFGLSAWELASFPAGMLYVPAQYKEGGEDATHLLSSSPSPVSQPCLLPLAAVSTPSSELHLPPLSSPGLQKGFSLKLKSTKQHLADNLWNFSCWHFPLSWHTLKGKEVKPQSALCLKSTSPYTYASLQLKAHLCLLLRPSEFNSLILGSAQKIPSSVFLWKVEANLHLKY